MKDKKKQFSKQAPCQHSPNHTTPCRQGQPWFGCMFIDSKRGNYQYYCILIKNTAVEPGCPVWKPRRPHISWATLDKSSNLFVHQLLLTCEIGILMVLNESFIVRSKALMHVKHLEHCLVPPKFPHPSHPLPARRCSYDFPNCQFYVLNFVYTIFSYLFHWLLIL